MATTVITNYQAVLGGTNIAGGMVVVESIADLLPLQHKPTTTPRPT